MKRLLSRSLILITLCIWTSLGLAADKLTLSSAAGYRQPMLELFERFQADTGIQVEGVFGNVKQAETQARQNQSVTLIVGDLSILEPTGILGPTRVLLGKGRPTLVAAPGRHLGSLQDLTQDAVRRIGIPNRKSAIFGRAAKTCLERMGLAAALEPKLIEVATVPQVMTYTVTGEVDAGFVNLTAALAQKDKIGAHVVLPEDCYDPIDIVAAVVRDRRLTAEARRFLDFLGSAAARDILKKYGL